MSPIVNEVSRENILAKTKAIRGIMRYCAEIPTAISLGFLNTLIKSSAFNVVPIVKRIMLKSKFKMFIPSYLLKTHLNELDKVKK